MTKTSWVPARKIWPHVLPAKAHFGARVFVDCQGTCFLADAFGSLFFNFSRGIPGMSALDQWPLGTSGVLARVRCPGHWLPESPSLQFPVWPWGKTYGSILGWMNIHLPPILMFTRGTGLFDPQPVDIVFVLSEKLDSCLPAQYKESMLQEQGGACACSGFAYQQSREWRCLLPFPRLLDIVHVVTSQAVRVLRGFLG